MAHTKKPPRPTTYVSLDETSRALLRSSVESAFVMDASGYILAANDAAAKMFNMKDSAALEQANIYELIPENTAGTRRDKIAEAIREMRPVKFEEEVEGRSLLHSIVPVINPWGEVSRLAINTIDLTDLRRIDEDLRREQQRQIFFMESLPGVVYHLYPDKTIRYANRYFRKYFGSPKGKDCQTALKCSETSCNGCPPMVAMETDQAMEWDWTDSMGRTFHLQCSPMTDSAGERMIMVLGIDITARKHAEDELQRAHDRLEDRVRQRTDELERTNTELTNKSLRLIGAMKKADAATRAKSAFLANMSHEIRTPLNAVLGMAELAQRVHGEKKKNSYLNRVREAGNSLLNVINDILDFSKIEARKLTLESIDFDVRHVVESSLDIHRLHTAEKSLFLTAHVDDDVPQALVGDPSRLKQVLVNLVSNAVKFTNEGGVEVRVSIAKAATQKEQEEEVTIEYAITDTGIGIPFDKQKLIFESFLQADDSVTRKHGGTGLGLAICKLLVELMHGRLRIRSTEGKGSTFSFTGRFQIGDPARIPKETEHDTNQIIDDLPKLKVLLADDNPLNRELAMTLLTEHGHTVVAAENGALALEAACTEPFDIILMDVQMPVMDGVSATRAIRDPNSGALNPDIPIIALTAHALKGDKERFIEAGMNEYIAKPIKMRDFYSTISSAMEGRTLTNLDTPANEGEQDNTDAFDRGTALEMLGGRDDLLHRMDEIFLRDVPNELSELQAFFANEDWDNAKRLAHSIKGSARTVGAQATGAHAEQLEFFCKQQDKNSANKQLKSLESEVKNALEFIKNEHAS